MDVHLLWTGGIIERTQPAKRAMPRPVPTQASHPPRSVRRARQHPRLLCISLQARTGPVSAFAAFTHSRPGIVV
jgi:hypothetical protein